ncbi:MAG: hypothetical protein EXS36_13040 [Pedosphaera sp.]|nr:hypothetical protein [Pedosphaera sp.]
MPKLYHDPSDLVVAVFCPDYGKKECCGLEWAAILDLIRKRQGQKIMLCRFGGVEVDGLYGAGFIELDECSPSKCATPILERLALNESKDGEDNSGRTEAVEEVAKSPDTTPRVSGRSEPKNEYPHIVNVVNELLRDSLEVGRFLQGCIFNIFEGNPPAVHLKPSVGWKEIERVPTLDAVVDELRKLEPKLDGLGDVPRRTSPPGLAFLF